MKNMKKRGISPLIATVLLIGFTITVAAVLMTWAGGYVREKAEKEGLKSAAEAECATSVNIKLKDIICGATNVELIIENTGSIKIDGLRLRLESSEKTEVRSLGSIDKTSQRSYSEKTIPGLESIQLLPIIIKEQEGKSLSVTCSDQMIKAKC